MELLNPLIFASIKASSQDSLDKIASGFLRKYLSSNEADEFCMACDALDYKKANEILNKAILAACGGDNVSASITLFANKFPELCQNLSSAYSEIDKISRIAKKSKEIRSAIEQQIVRRQKMATWGYIIGIFILVVAVGGGIAVWRLLRPNGKNNANQVPSGKKSVRRQLSLSRKPRYTEKDKDMILLIQQLSEIYRKTDDYLKK